MRVLFLCMGNRCRSQMAHGIVQMLHPDWYVCSAGVNPANAVHPFAVGVMAEMGVDISSYYPKHVEMYLEEKWDLVVTVCDGARENCPIFMGDVERVLHFDFDDPDAFDGSEMELLKEFRRIRDEIYIKMKDLC